MIYHQHLIESNECNLIPYGDIHLGDRAFNKESQDKLKANLEKTYKNPNARVILMGDIFNCSTRQSATSPYEQIHEQELDIGIQYFEKIAKQGKIIGALDGNHESFFKDTDVLTKDGWEKISKVDKKTELAQFDTESGAITFSEPLSLIRHYSEDLISVEGLHTKQMVTLNHDVIIGTEKIKAKNLLGADIKESLIRNRGSSWEYGTDVPDNELRLLTWVIMDATIVLDSKYNKNSKKVRIQFKLSKERKIEELKKLLEEMEIPFTFKLCKKTGLNKLQPYYIRIYGKYARDISEALKGKKAFTADFRHLNQSQLEVVLKAISVTDGGYRHNHLKWTTTSKNDVDVMQESCIKNNYSFSYKENKNGSGFENGKLQYVCNIFKETAKNDYLTIKKVAYKDIAYCVTMPMGSLVTRLDGKIAFTGNCRLMDFANFSMTNAFCKALKIPYLGTSVALELQVGKRNSLTRHGAISYQVYAHHTSGGGGTLGSKVNRTDKLRELLVGADVYLGGHNHQLHSVRASHKLMDTKSKQIISRDQYIVGCGSYLEWNNSYAERKQLALNHLGSPVITFKAGKRDIGVTI